MPEPGPFINDVVFNIIATIDSENIKQAKKLKQRALIFQEREPAKSIYVFIDGLVHKLIPDYSESGKIIGHEFRPVDGLYSDGVINNGKIFRGKEAEGYGISLGR
ncbi:hypothetical protein HQ529_04215 [Candidatus Woesearchaeota archaeon]|nr:hypothetical protein [Candidatus Woesearchaeota archaeon]